MRDTTIAQALGSELAAQRTDTAQQLAALDEKLQALPAPSQVYCAASDFRQEGSFAPARTPRPVFVLARGDVNQPQAPAVAGALSCVTAMEPRFELRDSRNEGMRRVALAHWLTDPRNPLTWRSIANRVWHYHFGRGIVETPNDFGRMGAAPTHPELLDWLAMQVLDNDESLKALTRKIVCSATYRQASVDNADYAGRTAATNTSGVRTGASWTRNRCGMQPC